MAKTPGSTKLGNEKNYYQANANIGSVTTFRGQDLMMRDSHLASSFYGFNTNSFTNTPKHDSLYYVKLVKGSASGSKSTSNSPLNGLTGSQPLHTNNTWETNFGFLAKEVTRPPVKFATEVVNQYNKKRVIHTKSDFGGLSINFYDTVDNQIMKMFLEYYQFYFGDAHNTSSDAWMNDIVSGKFNPGADDWGFQLNGNSANNDYFIERIEIYHIFAGKYSRMDLVHPKISDFGPSKLAFDSPQSATIQVEFQFEGMAFVENNGIVANNSGLVTDLRLADASFYQPDKDSNTELDWDIGNNAGLSQINTSTDPSEMFDSARISGLSLSGSAGNINSDQISEIGPPGVTGAYATEGSYTKMFNTLNQARVDTMTSQNMGQLASNIGFDFFNTGELSNQYQRFSNPTLRNQSLLGKFL